VLRRSLVQRDGHLYGRRDGQLHSLRRRHSPMLQRDHVHRRGLLRRWHLRGAGQRLHGCRHDVREGKLRRARSPGSAVLASDRVHGAEHALQQRLLPAVRRRRPRVLSESRVRPGHRLLRDRGPVCPVRRVWTGLLPRELVRGRPLLRQRECVR
jgi:hypothetical protein